MAQLTLTLSRKQQQALDLLEQQVITELLFGGGAGGGKSWLVCLWMVIQCRKYPGIAIGLGRKEMTNLGKTTAVTLLSEVHPVLGVSAGDFTYRAPGTASPGVTYRNGSSIPFFELAPAPTDPNFDRFGSLSLTHAVIEEGGEVTAKARSVFSSRKNRKLNKEYSITGKTVITCNPSPNFLREEFYEPYLALGGGPMQQWKFGDVFVHDVKVDAFRAFVRSLPTDNPFLSRNYIETLRSLSDMERRRLLEGDWDFDDDDTKLFKLHLFKQTGDVDADAEMWAGCDPSRGGDKTVFTAGQGNVVTDQMQLTIPAEIEDKGTFVAEHYIEWCTSHGVGTEKAAVDVVGIGASVFDSCIRLGFKVQAFNAGSTKGVRLLNKRGEVIEQPGPHDDGIPLFNNLRSQGYYDIAQAAHTGMLLFKTNLPYYDKLKLELGAHHYTTKDRQLVVESKDKIKAAIGHSPDFADSLLAANWVRTYKPRIGFRVRSA